MDGEKPKSIWKKELSFGRKPAAASPDADAREAVPSAAKEPAAPPLWKREVSLRRKPKPEQPEPVLEAPAEDPDLDAALSLLELEEAIVVLPPAPEPEEEPAPQLVQPIEHSWLTQPLEAVSEPPAEPLALAAPPAEVPELVAEQAAAPVPEPDLVELDLDVELPPVEMVADGLPELPADLLAQVLDPDPAPEPAAAPAPKVPFYKRELSLKRTPRERGPKPESKKAPKPKRERAAKATRSAEAKVPFYKRELSFKRAPKHWDPAEATVAPTAEPKPERASAPKRGPKLRRLPRPRPSLPSLSRGGGGGGGGKSVVGLKIGGSQIAVARVSNGATPELLQVARGPLEQGIVVGGELRDPDALTLALKEFFAQHKLPRRGVRLGIANNRIGVRTFDVVGIADPKQLANAVRFRAQEVLPIPLEEAVLDYQVLSETVNGEGQPVCRVLLVVAYRELVDRYVLACQRAGIQIVGIDLEAFALLRAIAPPHDHVTGSERGALVAVSVGHDRSTFAVSDGRICEFTRVLEWGGWALNVAIARALDSSPSEVERLKRALSLGGHETVPEGFTEDQLATARDAAKRQLQTFARELVSSLQFYQNQPGSLSIGEIVVTGGTAHLPGLGAELERLIGVPVRIADPLGRLTVSKRVGEPEQVGSLAVAIGLGIED